MATAGPDTSEKEFCHNEPLRFKQKGSISVLLAKMEKEEMELESRFLETVHVCGELHDQVDSEGSRVEKTSRATESEYSTDSSLDVSALGSSKSQVYSLRRTCP